MHSLSKHLINPDKLAETLNVKWKHYSAPEGAGIDKNSFIFELGDLHLSLHNCDSKELVLTKYRNESLVFEIRFDQITNILYLPKMRVVILESVKGDILSQIRIHADGTFAMQVSTSLRKRERWIEIAKQEEYLKQQSY